MDMTPLAGMSPGYAYATGRAAGAEATTAGPAATANATAAPTAAPSASAATEGPAGTDPAALAADRAEAKMMNDRFAEACRTCKSRKYQDGSNDPGVSFKSPQHIDPAASASVVMGHEQEHVAHEQAKANQEGGKVVSQSVVLHGDICPECGRYYIAGGTTTTVTRHGGGQQANNNANADKAGSLDITA